MGTLKLNNVTAITESGGTVTLDSAVAGIPAAGVTGTIASGVTIPAAGLTGAMASGVTGPYLGGTFRNIWMKTSTGSENFTVPAGITKIWVTACAGGSGGESSAWSTGGGAGAWCMDCECTVTPAQVISMTVGVAGAIDTVGGTTSIGSMITLNGGARGGAGGATTDPDNSSSYSTSTGFVSGLISKGGSGHHSSHGSGGVGSAGSGPFGQAGQNMNHSSHSNSTTGYGAGGHGKWGAATGANAIGAPGFIKVEY